MKSFVSLRSLATAAVVLGSVGVAASAHARSDIQVQIGLGSPFYVQPAPLYVQPRSYYVQPATVYVQPAPVYRDGAWGDRDRDGVPNIYDRYDNRQRPQGHRGGYGYGDADRDGVPNRYDRAPNNPYYR